MDARTCRGCGTDISSAHGNARYCTACRIGKSTSARICKEEGCGEPMRAEDLCQKHLWRWRNYGDPQVTRLVIGSPEKRFWSKVNKDGPMPVLRPELGRCWAWTDELTEHGYATLSVRNRPVYAHRFSYALLVRPIPPGLQIDHLCRNRGCVNPDHLEPVTSRVNTLRGDNPRVTSERCRGVSLSEEHRRNAAEGTRRVKRGMEPETCDVCGRVFVGCRGLNIHRAKKPACGRSSGSVSRASG